MASIVPSDVKFPCTKYIWSGELVEIFGVKNVPPKTLPEKSEVLLLETLFVITLMVPNQFAVPLVIICKTDPAGIEVLPLYVISAWYGDSLGSSPPPPHLFVLTPAAAPASYLEFTIENTVPGKISTKVATKYSSSAPLPLICPS